MEARALRVLVALLLLWQTISASSISSSSKAQDHAGAARALDREEEEALRMLRDSGHRRHRALVSEVRRELHP